ncbi:MAG: PDZ domain-containing protein, partial [Owenweeksia sp.]
MNNKYFLSLAVLAVSLLGIKASAQSEEENVQKETRVNITITRDGETRSITIDPENAENLQDVMDQVSELEDIELNNEDGDIEVIVRSCKGGEGFGNMEHLKDMKVFLDQKLHLEPRTFLGVVGQHKDNGIHLEKIISGTGAEKAGLKTGDVILEMDGRKQDSYKGFTDAIKAKKPGDKINLKIDRDGKIRNLEATLGESKDHVVEWASKDLSSEMPIFLDKIERNFEVNSDQGFLGVNFEMEGDQGVKVNKVIEESPAAQAGLRDGDIILSIDGKPTADGKTFLEAMSNTKKDQEIDLVLERDGKKINKKVTLGERQGAFFKKIIVNHDDRGDNRFFGDKDLEVRVS